MKTTIKKRQAAETKAVVYRGAGGAILGDHPGIKTKAQADQVIAALLGRTQQQP